MNILLILPLFFCILLYKYKRNMMAVPLIIYYLIGSFLGYAMTNNPLYKMSSNAGIQEPSISATLFLIFCFFILFYPILSQKSIKNITLPINYKYFIFFSYCVIIISSLYIVLIFPHIFNALNALDFVAYKEDVLESGLDLGHGSTFLNYLMSYQVAIRPIIIFLFCMSLAIFKRHKKLTLVLGVMAFLPPIFNSLAAAHRNIMVFSAIDCLLCFLIFRKYYTKKIKLVFYTIGGIFAILTIFIVIYFAILRFSSEGNDFFFYTMERYMGEPFVNFNTMLWGEDNYLWGNKCFTIFRKYLGMSYIDPNTIRDYSYNMQYVPFFFYSIVGNFYMDFGPIGTSILCIFICYLFYKLLSKKSIKQSNSSILLVYLYTSTMIKNYYYFIYMGYNFMNLIMLALSFYLIHKYIFNLKRNVQI